ncbi:MULTISPECIES: DUF397 domain-containing protein [Actinomycetes]|uniref:DUF397 domain-containing protein n=1 Tax=Streptoalloteichus tenebrarius (strain ATCC 17920 / DSM 40477 / JCM 4838 / CBS 697.72 / NBRC 16177 / NCIMB 11028 / NRRL B-12390 / A12253. 1 / ISP 5477) TaxID=1933 RepID=A0ABT1HLC5_STRSD|nr:DUF397 domain-containing protein [Streptoalloteichus tenebrarius]MCP2256321.1 protein of unknown function (DUF397) [Streptoalloteichus tenebrarius]BFF04660.1 DUF397 domain-containing protein [Streptoalloteichus tenebrarius]GHE87268.1 DUF397 domain-containing protein [Streptomyces griseoaurantiacus]
MVELDLSGVAWRKSSRSQNGSANCVEVANLSGVTGVRDSKNPSGPALVFAPAAFTAFIGAVKTGRLDLS